MKYRPPPGVPRGRWIIVVRPRSTWRITAGSDGPYRLPPAGRARARCVPHSTTPGSVGPRPEVDRRRRLERLHCRAHPRALPERLGVQHRRRHQARRRALLDGGEPGEGCPAHWLLDWLGRVAFQQPLLSVVGGRCYVSLLEGTVSTSCSCSRSLRPSGTGKSCRCWSAAAAGGC